jgi:kynurenine formamidase
LAINEEFIAGQLGQIGTQFDGLGHIGQEIEMDGHPQVVFYNGFTANEMDDRYGLARLGVENVRAIVTRGILVDLPSIKKLERLEQGYEVRVADVLAALERQQLRAADIREGDAVLFRYGWSQLWTQPDVYNDNPPGIGMEVASWLVDLGPVLIGSDSWGTEVTNAESALRNPVHQQLLTQNGIYNLENLNLERLAANDVYEFMLVVTPLPLVGATGSPIRPIALH